MSLLTPEWFDNICQKILLNLPKETVLSKETKIDIVKKITQFNGNVDEIVEYFSEELTKTSIRGIIYTETNIISLRDYSKVYLDSLVFELKINNIVHKICDISPGYYNIKTMSKELEHLKVPFRVIDSEKRIVPLENEELMKFFEIFRFINKFHYITILIPQLNWKKEIPIKNNSFFQFKIEEDIMIPKSSVLETKLNVIFLVDDRKLTGTEIFFNLLYELN